MKKQYVFIITFALLLLSSNGFSQSKTVLENSSSDIESLNIYPNPVSQGKIYISTLNNAQKKIEIYNVLGKIILTASIFQNELNISKLKAGVYIIKITENNITATRKLIVK
jgi:hypothetical protein